MTGSVEYAKAAVILSVIYAGVQVHTVWARFADVSDKAVQFALIASGAGAAGRLRFVRALFYLAAPLIYLWALMQSGLPGVFLVAAGVKFWISSFVGLRSEHRILSGHEYRRLDHRIARLDALANIALAAAAIGLVLNRWG